MVDKLNSLFKDNDTTLNKLMKKNKDEPEEETN